MDKPPWLEDEPEIKALLLSFAKRVDDNSATIKPLRSSLKLGHFEQNEQGDLSWELLNKLTPDLITIKLSPKRSDSAPDWSGALVYFDPSNKHKLFEWLDYNPDDSLQRWQQALEASDLAVFDSVNLASLKETPIAFPGKTDAAVIQKLVLIASNNARCNNRYHTLREISAHYFWGDSKFLDNKSDWLANSFTDLCVSARKVQVNYFLPKQYDQVLFVENLDTYHQLIQKRCNLTQTLAIVYAAGFRLTASRIRTQDGVSLHEAAQSQGCSQAKSQPQSEAFIDWWFGAEVGNLPCFFWGDFDFSGMGILKLLRHQFNDMQLWQPGYQAMLQQVEAGDAHPMSLRDKSGQTDPVETGCDYADTVILPLLRQHQSCFDQEGIDLDRLR
jgi:hypothetical protein